MKPALVGLRGRKTGLFLKNKSRLSEYFASDDESREEDSFSFDFPQRTAGRTLIKTPSKRMLSSSKRSEDGSYSRDMDLVESSAGDGSILQSSAMRRHHVNNSMQKRAVKVARRAGLVSSAATELPSDFSSEEEEEEEVKENVSFVNGTRQQHESTPIVKQHRLTIKRTPATPASSLQSVRQEEIDEFYAAGSNNNFIPSQPRIQRTPVGVIKQQENADNASDCENNDLYQGSPAPASSRRKSVMFQMPATEEKVVVQSQAVEDDIPWNDNNDQVYDCGAGEDYYKDCVASEAVDCDDKNKQQEEPPIAADDCFDNFSSEKEEQIMQKSKPKKSAMKKQQHKQPPAELTAEDEMRLKIFNKGGLKEINTDDGQVVKRSSRMRYRPLEFWRNERVVFGRRKSGPFPVPVIQEIVRVPQEEMSAKEKREKRQRQFVKKCQPIVSIVDPKGQDKKEIEKELIAPPVDPTYKSVHNADYKIGRLLTDPTNENLYSGVMMFPKGAEKPFRDSGEMTMFGFVMAGEIELTIHKTVVVIPRGGSFVVPKGNQYKFVNVGQREAKILFVNERSAVK